MPVIPRNSIRAESFGSTHTVSFRRCAAHQRLEPRAHVLSALHREARAGLPALDQAALLTSCWMAATSPHENVGQRPKETRRPRHPGI
jgi:hypothetical protein